MHCLLLTRLLIITVDMFTAVGTSEMTKYRICWLWEKILLCENVKNELWFYFFCAFPWRIWSGFCSFDFITLILYMIMVDVWERLWQFASDLLCGYFPYSYISFKDEFCFIDDEHLSTVQYEASELSGLISLIDIFRIRSLMWHNPRI
jgi:hypothetical protein